MDEYTLEEKIRFVLKNINDLSKELNEYCQFQKMIEEKGFDQIEKQIKEDYKKLFID